MKKLLSLLLVFTLCFSFSFALGEETQTFTDSVGREVTLPKKIERIVPSGSLSQMALFALAPQLFVGLASDWSQTDIQYIATTNVPVIGQVYGKGDINLESLAAVNPQVIIDIGEPKGSVVEDMDGLTQQTGIPAIHITANLDNMGDVYRTLGALLGLEERAEALATYCDNAYAKGLEVMEKVGEDNKVSVLYIAGYDGLRVIPKSSFNSQTLDMFTNNVAVLENVKGNSAEVDMEQIYLFEPEIIFFDEQDMYNSVAEDPLWKDVAAIASNNYVMVPYGPYNWIGFPPSVQRYLGILWMGTLLYPEVADWNLYEEVSAYYELFYQKPLSQEAFDAIVKDSFVK